jgi:hypothetical protein
VRAQPRSITRAEQRARATRPDLWPAFLDAVFPERPAPAPDPVDDLEELVDRALNWDG